MRTRVALIAAFGSLPALHAGPLEWDVAWGTAVSGLRLGVGVGSGAAAPFWRVRIENAGSETQTVLLGYRAGRSTIYHLKFLLSVPGRTPRRCVDRNQLADIAGYMEPVLARLEPEAVRELSFTRDQITCVDQSPEVIAASLLQQGATVTVAFRANPAQGAWTGELTSAEMTPAREPADAKRPFFTREGVIPFQADRPRLLAPGMIVTIWGERMGPALSCSAGLPRNGPYPTEFCGVRVTAGGRPAQLMWATDKQINLTLPADAPSDGSAPLQVCTVNGCSDPVVMRFSVRKSFLRVEGTPTVHGPLWIALEEPMPYEVYYPCTASPWDLSYYEFEVRRNGRLLPRPIVPAKDHGIGSGSGCSATERRSALPLHVMYQLTQPGTYFIRLTNWNRSQWPRHDDEISSRSDWTRLVLKPFDAAKRDAWLAEEARKAHSASNTELLGDIIPSLLAWPDEKALRVLAPLLDHPDSSVRQFAETSLGAFESDVLRRVISARLSQVSPFGARNGPFPAEPAGDALASVPRTSAPVPLFKVDPEYSAEAISAKFQGAVLLQVVIDATGKPTDIKVLHALGLGLDEKVIEAVSKWKFRPAARDGRPVAITANVEVTFRLEMRKM